MLPRILDTSLCEISIWHFHLFARRAAQGRICTQGSLAASPSAHLQQQEPARPPQSSSGSSHS